MRRVIFNQKGGVGKSSIAVNLAAISATKGLKTLLVDLDTQGNATQYLWGKKLSSVMDNAPDIGTFFNETLSFKLLPSKSQSFVHPTPYPNLDIIPSSEQLAQLQPQLETKHKIYKLREMLRSLNQYDAIYIDTPPAYNFFTLSALIATNTCLIPFDCDEFSRQALHKLIENINETKSDHNRNLSIEGIIINQFQPRASLPQKIVNSLKQEGLPILNAYLSSSVKMRESHDQSKPLIHSFPNHKLTSEFLSLFYELHPQMKIETPSAKSKSTQQVSET